MMLKISLGAYFSLNIPQLRILSLALHPIVNSVFDSLECNFLSSLYILDISPLSIVGLVNIFSQSVACYFVLLTVSFALQKLCKFMRYHLSILDLRAQTTHENLPCAHMLEAFPHFPFY